jgi:hypothetical protein
MRPLVAHRGAIPKMDTPAQRPGVTMTPLVIIPPPVRPRQADGPARPRRAQSPRRSRGRPGAATRSRRPPDARDRRQEARLEHDNRG